MTKIVDEFNNLPFTRRELLKHVQSQVNRPIIALFWTGSRVNNLARLDSDYDVLAITNVTNEDLLNFNHYRETVKSKLYSKDLEIKVIDIISLYQSLSKSNWILLEALSQRSISTDQYFQPLFATLSDSNWLISSCLSRYAKAAIGQSLSILNKIRHNHPRWRHDIYYIVKLNNYLQQFIDHSTIYGNVWHLTTKDLKDVQLARHVIANHELKDLNPDQAYPMVQDLVNNLKNTANKFEQVYQNYNTQTELTELFSNWMFNQRKTNN